MTDMLKVCAVLALFVGWIVFGTFRCVDAYTHCSGGVVVKDYMGLPTCVKPHLEKP